MTQLDLSPLEGGGGVRARLRSLGSEPRLVVGTTLGAVILLLPLIGILVAVLGTGTDWGFVGTMTLLAACGAWGLIDVLRTAGTGAGLESFAEANDLELTRSLAARDYTGSRFRSGERIILRSLRTRTSPALEVSDTWPTERIRYRVRSSGAVTAANAPQAEGFLRVVLPPGAPPSAEEFPMTPQLDDALWRLLGPYGLEVHDGEITVMGSHPLEPERPEQVTAAFELAAALAQLAPASRGAVPDAPAAEPARPESGRRTRHPLAIVAAVLAMFIGGSVGFALVMSSLENRLRGDESAAGAVIGVLILAISALVVFVLRWATSRPRRSRGDAARRDERSSRSG